MKKFTKSGKDTNKWAAYKKGVLDVGGMIGNSPMAHSLAKKQPKPGDIDGDFYFSGGKWRLRPSKTLLPRNWFLSW
jgi:hypothetical protein